MTGRPIDYTKRVEGNPQRIIAEFEVGADGSLHVVEAKGEVKINQYATRMKKLKARSVHRVLRNAGIKRTLTVN
jgi:hypothetical protein